MAFMKPECEEMEAIVLDTTEGMLVVPFDTLTIEEHNDWLKGNHKKAFRNYTTANTIFSATFKKGWFGRLSASGYLDSTEYVGPYSTEKEVLEAIMELYQVDEDGNSVD